MERKTSALPKEICKQVDYIDNLNRKVGLSMQKSAEGIVPVKQGRPEHDGRIELERIWKARKAENLGKKNRELPCGTKR